MLKEVLCLCARGHLRAHGTTVALERWCWQGPRRFGSGCLRASYRELRVPVHADGSKDEKREDHTDWPCSMPSAFGRSRPTRCCPLPRAHDADCPHLTVRACLCLKGYELADAGALTVLRERGDVNEDIRASISRRNEAEAPIVVPFCQSSMGAHQKGLTPELSRGAKRHRLERLVRLQHSPERRSRTMRAARAQLDEHRASENVGKSGKSA